MHVPARILRRTLPLLSLLFLARPAVSVNLPPGFSDHLVTNAGSPTALAFTPDGRLLITDQHGTLLIVQGGTLLGTPALDISAKVCSDHERGLDGVAVDPSFAANHFIYLYYTFSKFNSCGTDVSTVPVERVSRFTLPDTNVIDQASELVLIDNVLNWGGIHNAGDLVFGPDGDLYVSIGDGGDDYAGDSGSGGANDATRDRNILNGKILRIAPDGSIPATNPFQGPGTARCNRGPASSGTICQETWAWGFRNPFRFAFQPGSGRLFVNDVGQDAWEEIDDVTTGGGDYGWNCREGAHANSTTGKCSPPPAGMIDPQFNYQHNTTIPGTSQTGCNAITGGAFVPVGVWPSAYDGIYLFADFICGGIFQLTTGPFAASDFATALGGGSVVHLLFGPSTVGQSLYYTTYGGGGQIHRIDGPSPTPAATSFTPLSPCRVFDTRNATGPLGGPALVPDAARNFTLSGQCGIPADAVAISANVTVANEAVNGAVQLAPTGGVGLSTISFHAGVPRANNAILGLFGVPPGMVTVTSLFPAGSVDLIIDVTGYFR